MKVKFNSFSTLYLYDTTSIWNPSSNILKSCEILNISIIHLSYTICIISIWMIMILVRAQDCVEANLFFDHEWTIAFFHFEIIIGWIRFSLMALILKQSICILMGQEMWNTFWFEKALRNISMKSSTDPGLLNINP